MASRKVFYDIKEPRMLSDDEMARMTAGDINAACDQVDQHIVSTLQNIDRNLSNANRTVIEKVLPKVTQYGESSKSIWDSVKFWLYFFEASAQTKLSGEAWAESDIDGEMSSAMDEEGADGGDSSTLSFDERADRTAGAGDLPTAAHPRFSDASSRTSTPRVPRSGATTVPHSAVAASSAARQHIVPWSADESPFEALEKDLRRFDMSSAKKKAPVASSAPRHHRPHSYVNLHDLSLDSPEIQRPELETAVLDAYVPGAKGKQRAPMSFDDMDESALDLSSASPRMRAASERMDPSLLKKVLANKSALPMSGRKSAVAPSPRPPGSPLPNDIPRGWDGLTRLSNTPMSAYDSPRKSGASQVQQHLQQQQQYSRTRGPTTGNLFSPIGDDGGLPLESPADEPPSVSKNWATRGYDIITEGARIEDDSDNHRRGDGGPDTRASLDDDDDDGFEAGEHEASQRSMMFDEGASGISDGLPPQRTQDYTTRDPAAGPEDTLFGAGFAQQQHHQHQQQRMTAPGAADARLRMLGPEEMHTLHGGQLLASEPFQGSPLAGRDRREL